MNMPSYPAFRPLDLGDKKAFDAAFAEYSPEISEFTFTNLFAWRQAYRFHVSLFDAWIIVSSHQQPLKKFFAPIGTGDSAPIIKTIMSNQQGIFIRLPGPTAAAFTSESDYIVTLDRDNADYCYTTDSLIALPGRKYDGKRNLIRKFKARHRYDYLKLTKDNIGECLDFADYWCVLRDCESVETLKNEKQAVIEMVENCSVFSLIGGAIRVDGKFAAVAIAEKLNADTLVMHVLKAVADMEGLYQTILNEFLAHEAKDFAFINFEQDLGIEGLRKAKLSYHPVRLVDKYTLTRQDSAGR